MKRSIMVDKSDIFHQTLVLTLFEMI